jgi:hypothetical protein
MIYALIRAGVVVNTIEANPSFLPTIAGGYSGPGDAIVRIDDLTVRPGIYWTYDDGKFTPGSPPEDIP